MTANFKISTHRSNEDLHLSLIGDFDGNSAWEVFNLLKKNAKGFHRIIIHNDCLNIIYPFGVKMFRQIIRGLKKYPVQLLFTGEKAGQILPEKDSCFYAIQHYKESRIPHAQERG